MLLKQTIHSAYQLVIGWNFQISICSVILFHERIQEISSGSVRVCGGGGGGEGAQAKLTEKVLTTL